MDYGWLMDWLLYESRQFLPFTPAPRRYRLSARKVLDWFPSPGEGERKALRHPKCTFPILYLRESTGVSDAHQLVRFPYRSEERAYHESMGVLYAFPQILTGDCFPVFQTQRILWSSSIRTCVECYQLLEMYAIVQSFSNAAADLDRVVEQLKSLVRDFVTEEDKAQEYLSKIDSGSQCLSVAKDMNPEIVKQIAKVAMPTIMECGSQFIRIREPQERADKQSSGMTPEEMKMFDDASSSSVTIETTAASLQPPVDVERLKLPPPSLRPDTNLQGVLSEASWGLSDIRRLRLRDAECSSLYAVRTSPDV
ncbi:hypothetical protein HPB51_003209 [Rhipicephalus microplus]|uniref:Uncharacterized protein n=1 Tax=Rhipicephalus microplus TaxID=6941 RepID=A0A9J6EKQ6_RHIMP|nr:hypothetical protein HPB51_003209 [Rhipicephalus microplus]